MDILEVKDLKVSYSNHTALEKINFKYDGTDKLYLLGDYVDWGPKSLETLLFVKELSEKYDFIFPLIGNHDLMFLEQIQNPYYQDNS